MGAHLSALSKISPGSRKTCLSLTKLQVVPFIISLTCEIAKFSLTASPQEIPDMLECLMAAMAALLMVSAIYILVKDVYLRKDELLAPPPPTGCPPPPSRRQAAASSGSSGGRCPLTTRASWARMKSPSRISLVIFPSET